jgi:hypothetical protein
MDGYALSPKKSIHFCCCFDGCFFIDRDCNWVRAKFEKKKAPPMRPHN